MIWTCTKTAGVRSGEFDAWWKARFAGLLDGSIAVKTLFETWDVGTVLAEPEAKKFIVQMVKGSMLNSLTLFCPFISDPSMTSNLGSQSVQAGEVVVTSVIAVRDLELPFGDEEDDYETLAEASVEITPSTRKNKRKEVTQAQDSVVQLDPLVESFPPPSKAKKLRKKAFNELDDKEEPAAVPAETTETNEELREAFEAVEQEKEKEKEKEILEGEKEKKKDGEEEEEIPTEIIAESIELAKKQQEAQRTEPTSSELALFDDVKVEHFAAIPASEVEEGRTTGMLAVVTSPLKPPIVADLDAQLDGLEQLSFTPGKAKSKAVDEAADRVKIWQSTELDLDENKEAIDKLMQDLDLLHRQNVAPRPILESSLGLARDVLNLHNCYEDL
ncbi:unnamed protein product [Prunus armeniaca]